MKGVVKLHGYGFWIPADGIMEVRMTGMLAESRAGHDRKKLYVIIGEDNEYVYLADGGKRTVNGPKKKNKKHIQVIKRVRMEQPAGGYSDLEIKKTIKMYQEEANVKG